MPGSRFKARHSASALNRSRSDQAILPDDSGSEVQRTCRRSTLKMRFITTRDTRVTSIIAADTA